LKEARTGLFLSPNNKAVAAMNILKRTFTVILTILLVLSVFAVFALKSGFFTVDARDYVVSLIKKSIGKDVRIGRIELGLIDNIVIHDVSIPVEMTFGQKGEFASIKRIIIRFNLIDLINHRDIDKTLSSVIIDSPLINIKKEKGEYNVGEFAASFNTGGEQQSSAQLPIPVNRIRIENGRVVYNDLDRKFISQITSLFGNVSLKQKPMMISVSLSGRTVGSDRNNLGVDVDYYMNRKTFRGSVEIRDAALNDWGAYILSPVDYSINSGNFSVVASVSGEGFKPGAMSVYGYMGLSGGDILIKGAIPVKNIGAMVEVNNDSLKFKNTGFTLFGGKGVLKGSAKNIFTSPEYKANFSLDGVDMAQVSPGNMSGTAKAFINISGTGPKMTGQAAVMWPSGMLRSMEIKDAAIRGTVNAGVFNITSVEGTVGDGKLTGSGSAGLGTKDRKSTIIFSLNDLRAGELFNSKDFSGNIDLSLKAGGTLDKMRLTAMMSSPAFKYGGNNVEKFNGNFTLAGEALNGSASMAYKKYRDLKLNLKSQLSDAFFTLESFKLDNGAENLVDTKGKINRKDGAMDIAVVLNNVMLSDLSLDYLSGKDVDGAVKGGLFIRGTASAPVLDLNLSMDGLKIRGAPYKLYAGVHYGGNLIKINEINFNDSLKGTGEFSLKKKIFGMNFDVKGLKGDVLSEITGMKIFDSSVIDGKVYVRKEQSGYGGTVDLDVAYSKGLYKGAKIEVSGQNNSFNVSKFEIKQKNGSVVDSGTLTIANDDQITAVFSGKFENYRLNDRLVLDGAFRHSSSINVSGDTSSSVNTADFTGLSFNGKPQQDLTLSLKTENFSVREFKAKWGQEYYAEATVDNDAKVPQLNALIRIKDADLYPIYTLTGRRDTPLKKASMVSGGFFAKGPLDSASFGGTLSQEQGSVTTQGIISVEKQKGVYAVTRINVKYTAVNVDLNNFISIFNEKYRDSGRVNGSGELKGPLSKLESKGILTLAQGRLFDLPYDSIDTQYSYADKKVTLDRGELNYKNTFLKLDGSAFEVKGDNDYYATVKSQMKDYIWKGNLLNGSLNFYGAINTEKDLKIDGSIGSENFSFKKHLFKPFVINLSYRKDSLKLNTSKGKARINADIMLEKDRITIKSAKVDEENNNRLLDITGFIDTRKDGNSSLGINVKEADPQMANDLLGWDHTWTGTGNGHIDISGNPDKGLNYAIDVTLQNGSVDNVPFDIFTGLVAIRDNYVDLSPTGPMQLSKEGKYNVNVSGKIPIAQNEAAVEKMKGAEMSLHAWVKDGDLSLIKFLKFVDDASGLMNADLTIKGTKEFPTVSGKVSVTDGDIKPKFLFKDLKNVYANVLITDNVMDIYNMRGDTERGTIKISNLNEKKGGTMKFMKPYDLNWKITNIGDKIRFTDTDFLQFISGDADVNLEVTGPIDGPNIKGTMKFENAKMVYPVKMMNKTGEQVKVNDDNNFVKKINWDLTVFGGDNCRYYNNFFNNYADITLRFNNDKPVAVKDRGNDMKISGLLGIVKGTYKYGITNFTVDDTKDSTIKFDGDRRPILDVYMTTVLYKFPLNTAYGQTSSTIYNVPAAQSQGSVSTLEPTDITINLRFHGRVGDIKLDISGTSLKGTLDQGRLINIITLGKDSGQLAPADALKLVDYFVNGFFKSGTEMINTALPIQVNVNLQNSDKLVSNMAGGSKTVSPGDTTRTANVDINISTNLGPNWTLNYNPTIYDVTNQLGQGTGIQHKLDATLALDKNSQLDLGMVVGANPSALGPVGTPGQVDLRATLKTNVSFDQWGAKPTSTPLPTPSPRPTVVTK
jgi:autotransporter translocation and assembly factor TamB